MSKRNVCTVIVIFCCSIYLPVFGQQDTDTDYVPDEILVRFSPKENQYQRTKAEMNALADLICGGSIERSFKYLPGLCLVKLPQDKSVGDALELFNNREEILYAEPNHRIRAVTTIPDDTYFNDLWGLQNTGQTGGTIDADIGAPEAWDIRTDAASDMIVAVIDTGIDYNHPDLADNMWINEDELNGTPGVDDDGNGYDDDIYGYDFCTFDGKQRDSDPNDDKCHGTHVAGIIGAVGNNGEGVTGVCWNVKIMAIKTLNFEGYGNISDAIVSIKYAVDNGAKILNNSWEAGDYNESLRSMIEYAHEKGVIFIAAAGNSGFNRASYPGRYDLDNIITVMATDREDVRSDWGSDGSSNWGKESVDLAAPGSDILSTFPTYLTPYMSGEGYSTFYESLDGTSMAAPYVAGACALVWSLNPEMGHLEVKNVILNTVDRLDSLNGLCVTAGRLNLFKAFTEASYLTLDKADDVGLADPNETVDPNDYVTYFLFAANPFTDQNDPNYIGLVEDVEVVDYLPDGIDVNDITVSTSYGGDYNSGTHTARWLLPRLVPGGEPNEMWVTVRITEEAEPLGELVNIAEIIDAPPYSFAVEVTPIGRWNGIVYVDEDAPFCNSGNNGATWAKAYPNLQDALAVAEFCDEIWVAEGVYRPSQNDVNISFDLPTDVKLYGGFCGTETERARRDWENNLTILSGDLEGDNESEKIVTCLGNVGNAVLDGFTVSGGMVGIFCDQTGTTDNYFPHLINCVISGNSNDGVWLDSSSDVKISDCLIKGNGDDGVYCFDNSDIYITNSIIEDNQGNGLFFKFNTDSNITNCRIWGNGEDGINSYNLAKLTIKNNWIYSNGDDGIYYQYTPYVEENLIRHNTIAYNEGSGISVENLPELEVKYCILWGNKDQLVGNVNARFSCIQDLQVPDANGNINDDPCFLQAVNNDFHLRPASSCIDTFDPNSSYDGETDIDGQLRVMNCDYDSDVVKVDMGADEACAATDFDCDGVINLGDYALLVGQWLYEPPALNPRYDLRENDKIDFWDLFLLSEDWLWQACWYETAQMLMMGGGGGEKSSAPEKSVSQSAESQTSQQETYEQDLTDLIEWILKFKPPGWEEFLKILKGLGY